MSKYIQICVKQQKEEGVNSEQDELAFLEPEKYGPICPDHIVSNEEFTDALDIIAAVMIQQQFNNSIANVDDKLASMTVQYPDEPVDMTMEQIEQIVGRKIRLVSVPDNKPIEN